MKNDGESVARPPSDSDASAELMVVRCANCGKWMDVKPGRINYISHGLCEDCYETEMRKLARNP